MTATQKKQAALIIDPPGKATYSVIWMHGLGADGNDFVPVVPLLGLPQKPGIRFIFPHAPFRPVTINDGQIMRAWFDIYSLSTDGNLDEKGISHSAELITDLIAREEASGIQASQIFLAGFSQGAAMALLIGLQFPKKLAGMIALSGFLPYPQKILGAAPPANKQTPIFIAHGTEDPIVPYHFGKMTSDALQQACYPVTWHSYPMPHCVCDAEIADLSIWIQEQLN